MRFAVLAVLAVPAFGQMANRPAPTAAASVPKSTTNSVTQARTARIPLSAFVALERNFDAKLASLGAGGEPIDALGSTRGIYLDGYGVVFTTEMGLVALPTVNPFNQTITDATKNRVHSTKVTRLTALKSAITEMAKTVASNLGQVPDNQQVVIAVRLSYAPWENTSGLPGLIVAKADRRSAVLGNFQLEEQ
jgi:hypothetical protein